MRDFVLELHQWFESWPRRMAGSVGGGVLPDLPENRKGQYSFESTRLDDVQLEIHEGLENLLHVTITFDIDEAVMSHDRAFRDYWEELELAYEGTEEGFAQYLVAQLEHDSDRLAKHGLRLAADHPIERMGFEEHLEALRRRQREREYPAGVIPFDESIRAQFREMRRKWEESK